MPVLLIGDTEVKVACKSCIKGHRSKGCEHWDRPLLQVRPPGRPQSACQHAISDPTCNCSRRSYYIPGYTPRIGNSARNGNPIILNAVQSISPTGRGGQQRSTLNGGDLIGRSSASPNGSEIGRNTPPSIRPLAPDEFNSRNPVHEPGPSSINIGETSSSVHRVLQPAIIPRETSRVGCYPPTRKPDYMSLSCCEQSRQMITQSQNPVVNGEHLYPQQRVTQIDHGHGQTPHHASMHRTISEEALRNRPRTGLGPQTTNISMNHNRPMYAGSQHYSSTEQHIPQNYYHASNNAPPHLPNLSDQAYSWREPQAVRIVSSTVHDRCSCPDAARCYCSGCRIHPQNAAMTYGYMNPLQYQSPGGYSQVPQFPSFSGVSTDATRSDQMYQNGSTFDPGEPDNGKYHTRFPQ